jgi:ribosomal protein S18 acetylase RimI-like enzyme
LSFRLVKEPVTPPFTKRYPFNASDPAERGNWDFAAIAEGGGRLEGFLAAQHVTWNRRVVIHHLYVLPIYRGKGVGTALLAAADAFARSVRARCLWLETQNVNYPAIQFYRRAGFTLCGFDETLYDTDGAPQQEVALFFARQLAYESRI